MLMEKKEASKKGGAARRCLPARRGKGGRGRISFGGSPEKKKKRGERTVAWNSCMLGRWTGEGEKKKNGPFAPHHGQETEKKGKAFKRKQKGRLHFWFVEGKKKKNGAKKKGVTGKKKKGKDRGEP